MNIGEKIKTIRTERGLTQKDLAGGEITRNMLSRIENGCALPSLQTLGYLAERLGVPAGFLIADESEDFIYRKGAEIAKIRESYRIGDWKGCERLCRLLGTSDSETGRYVTGCLFHEAKECFDFGELRKAGVRLRAVRERCLAGKDELYPDGLLNRILAAECEIYLECLSDISPAFAVTDDLPVSLRTEGLTDSFALYYTFYRPNGGKKGGFRPGEREAEVYAASRPPEESFYAGHIRARLLMKKGSYREACGIIRDIAYGESLIPQPVLLFLLSDLEKCYKELSDFKSAYECAGLHRELLDSFLGDRLNGEEA